MINASHLVEIVSYSFCKILLLEATEYRAHGISIISYKCMLFYNYLKIRKVN